MSDAAFPGAVSPCGGAISITRSMRLSAARPTARTSPTCANVTTSSSTRLTGPSGNSRMASSNGRARPAGSTSIWPNRSCGSPHHRSRRESTCGIRRRGARTTAIRRDSELVLGFADLVAEAVAGAHGALGLSLVFALADRLALLELALALRDGDLDLRPAVREVEPQRHERVSAGRDRVRQLDDLVLVQQQLARALGGVVGPVALRVLRNVDGVEVGLSPVDEGIAVREVRTPLAKGLHLCARKHEPRLIRLLD